MPLPLPRKRGALVGFGSVAEQAHAPAFRASRELELVAVAEERPERRAAAIGALPGARAYESLAALLAAEKGLDFAVVATPPFLHAAQARACLEAGLPVLCEKPLTLETPDLETLSALADEKGLALMTVHNWACSPQWLKIFELADAGALGELRSVALEVLRTKPAASALPGDWRREAARAGGGILVDHGWHCLYLLRRLLPEGPRRLAASWHLPAEGGVEDEASLLLDSASASAFLHLSWRAAVRRNTATLSGSRGTLELRDDHLLLWRGASAPERTDFAQALSAGSAHPEWLSAFLPGFAAALEAPERGRANLEEARFCARTLRRAYQALGSGREAPLESLPA